MKKPILTLLLILITSSLYSQDITGQWNGILNVMGNQLKLVFHIQKTDSGYSATFDSPDQGARGIPFTSTTFNDPALRLTATNIGAVYEGTFKGDSIVGTWNQGRQAFPLNLLKETVEKKEYKRPQEPEKPYPYYEERVTFKNEEDSLMLAGTLTLPEENGLFPAVILISGSGAQNRNGEVFGHKPFLVLADHLTRQGIAVLRYDDRGTAESTGNYNTATSKDFVTDVVSAVAYLKGRDEINEDYIGLIGHSEGGLIAPIAANQSDDVSFVVLLAGPGVPGKEISLMQARTLRRFDVPDEEAYNRFTEKSLEIASSDKDLSVLREELTRHYKNSEEVIQSLLPEGTDTDTFISRQVESLLHPWARFFYIYDPAVELRKLSIPVLSLIGSKDVQVPADMNHPAIRKALTEGGNNDFVIKELPGLNHMFQESKTGGIEEYVEIEQTFSPVALREITSWIKGRMK